MVDKSTDQEQLKEHKIPQIQVRIQRFHLNNQDQVQQKDSKVALLNNN